MFTRIWAIKTVLDEASGSYVTALDEEHKELGDKYYHIERSNGKLAILFSHSTVTIEWHFFGTD